MQLWNEVSINCFGPAINFILKNKLSKCAPEVNVCVNDFTLFRILELDICLMNAVLNVAKSLIVIKRLNASWRKLWILKCLQ